MLLLFLLLHLMGLVVDFGWEFFWFIFSHAAKLPLPNLQQSQQNPMIPVIQECVDAITEHQRLHALMKGEWVKGLLPQSSIQADYTVQRIRGQSLIFHHMLISSRESLKSNLKFNFMLTI